MPTSITLAVSVSMLPSTSLPFLGARFVVELVPCGWGAAQGTVLGFVLPRILWSLIRADSNRYPVLQEGAAAFFSKVPACEWGGQAVNLTHVLEQEAGCLVTFECLVECRGAV